MQLLEEKLFLNVFFSGTFPGELVGGFVGRKVTLSDFHCGGAYGLSQSVRGPRDVIYFLTALTNSLQTSISKVYFWRSVPGFKRNTHLQALRVYYYGFDCDNYDCDDDTEDDNFCYNGDCDLD